MTQLPGSQQGTDSNGSGFQTPPTPQPSPVQPTDAGALTLQLQAQLNELQSRFNGQQGAIQREVEAKKKAQTDFMELNTTYAQEKANWENQFKTANEKVQTLTQQMNERDAKLQKYERQAQVRQVIASDFKPLVSLYDEGLLIGAEQLEGEDLKTYLTKFQTVADKLRETAVVQNLAGSTPTPTATPNAAALSKDQLTEQLMKMSPLDPKYDDVKAQWEQANGMT